MWDVAGRAYAAVAKTKVGTRLEPDGDFTCMRRGAVRTVHADATGSLYVRCRYGEHHLAGQLAGHGTYYVGLYPAE